MGLGVSAKFNILQESPLDRIPPQVRGPEEGTERPPDESWVASRYNVQTTAEDGSLIVWNTLRGAMSIFRPDQRDQVRSILTRRGVTGKLEDLTDFLSQRGFLVKAGSDEYRAFQHLFGHQHYRQDTLELVLLASEDCNFRCQYCYEDFARGTMKPEVREAVKKLVKSRLPNLRHMAVSWFGGEPLYGWQAIEDLAPFFRGIAAENGISFRSNMTTNGYLLEPDIAEKLISWGVLTYQITLDGAPEDHDRHRPGRNGEPTFDVIFRNLLRLRDRPEIFVVKIRINFDKQNQGGLGTFIAMLGKEFGGDPRFEVFLRSVGQWGGANDDDLDVCGAKESHKVYSTMVEELLQHNLTNSDDVRHKKAFGSQACYAARPYNFIIGADGLVMKCTVDLDKKDRNIVGRLNEDGTLTLDEDRFALWTEPAFASDQKCQKCVVLPLCQGISCPQIRFDENRSPCVPLRRDAKKGLIRARKYRLAAKQ